jgi:hypothetical protein
LIATIVLAAGATAASAQASTGAFTRAGATPDWSHGNIAGSVTWTECNANCDSWLALVFVQPTTLPCRAEEWSDSGEPNEQMVYDSLGQHANATLSFEKLNESLLRGVYGQRLCMIGIQSTRYGPGPDETVVGQELLASKVMEVETPPAPAPTTTAPPAPAPPAVSTKCILAGREVRRLQKKLSTALQRSASSAALKAERQSLARAKRRKKAEC